MSVCSDMMVALSLSADFDWSSSVELSKSKKTRSKFFTISCTSGGAGAAGGGGGGATIVDSVSGGFFLQPRGEAMATMDRMRISRRVMVELRLVGACNNTLRGLHPFREYGQRSGRLSRVGRCDTAAPPKSAVARWQSSLALL